jgi:hypothetical protein
MSINYKTLTDLLTLYHLEKTTDGDIHTFITGGETKTYAEWVPYLEKKTNIDLYLYERLLTTKQYILFFDIDNCKLSIDELKKRLLVFFDNEQLPLGDDDICYTINAGKSGSFRICIPKYYGFREKQHLPLVQKFINQNPDLNDKIVDIANYKGDRNLRMPKSLKAHEGKWIKGTFIEFDPVPIEEHRKKIHIIKKGTGLDFLYSFIPEYSMKIPEYDIHSINSNKQKKIKYLS